MRKLLALALVMTAFGAGADPAAEVREAELAFARAFAERDAERFFSFVADDATFLSGLTTSRGKAEVVAAWSRFFEGPEAPFSWLPERVNVSADGRIALSTGPVFVPSGRHAGEFTSTWRKNAAGVWQVVFDSSGPGPAARAEEVPVVEEGTVTTPDGAKLHYRKSGRGRTALVVPLDSQLHDYLRQFSDVATVITYDLRNHGRSSRVTDPATLSIEQDVADLETVRKHFNVDQIVPVGYSDLGKVVAMYAVAYPERVSRFIQLAPSKNEPRDVDGPVDMKDYPPRIEAASLPQTSLAKLTMPALVIHGTADRNAPYASGVDWASILPNARLVRLEGAAHAVWLDAPLETFSAMRAFLRGDWPVGGGD